MIIVTYVSNARNWLAVSSSLIWAGIQRLMPQNSKKNHCTYYRQIRFESYMTVFKMPKNICSSFYSYDIGILVVKHNTLRLPDRQQ